MQKSNQEPNNDPDRLAARFDELVNKRYKITESIDNPSGLKVVAIIFTGYAAMVSTYSYSPAGATLHWVASTVAIITLAITWHLSRPR